MESLKGAWDNLIPGFHHWFTQKRVDIFSESLTLTVRPYYSNDLELKHRLQKKKLKDNDVSMEIVSVTETLQKWVKENFLQEVTRAIYGQGKYRLAPGYESFFVDPTQFLKWSKDRQHQHLQKFMNYVAPIYTTYQKPYNAGNKGNSGGQKRRARLPEPTVFTERINPSCDPKDNQSLLTPVKIRKSTGGS